MPVGIAAEDRAVPKREPYLAGDSPGHKIPYIPVVRTAQQQGDALKRLEPAYLYVHQAPPPLCLEETPPPDDFAVPDSPLTLEATTPEPHRPHDKQHNVDNYQGGSGNGGKVIKRSRHPIPDQQEEVNGADAVGTGKEGQGNQLEETDPEPAGRKRKAKKNSMDVSTHVAKRSKVAEVNLKPAPSKPALSKGKPAVKGQKAAGNVQGG